MRERLRSGVIGVDGQQWQVVLYSDAWLHSSADVWLDGEEPLTIEWEKKDIAEAVQGSSATLKVISDSDRALIDLYTVKQGGVRLEVYHRATGSEPWALWWCGALDPEFYEEPYESESGYTVELTFTDLGGLDRIEWDKSEIGMVSVWQVVQKALNCGWLPGITADVSLVSLSEGGKSGAAMLDAVGVLGSNFVDEDGEASTLLEVLEAMCVPLGIKVKQRAGKLWLYDLNGLSGATPSEWAWNGASQTLGTGEVASRVVITFSPYADGEVIDGEVEPDDVMGKVTAGDAIYVDNEKEGRVPVSGIGFRIGHTKSPTTAPVMRAVGNAEYFRVDPIYSGSKEAGVVWGYRSDLWSDSQRATWRVNAGVPECVVNGLLGQMVGATVWPDRVEHMRTDTIIEAESNVLPAHSGDDYQLKVSLAMVMDVRYNPYEGSNVYNEEGNCDRLANVANFAYIPCHIELLDPSSGAVLYHYRNKGIFADGYKQESAGWVSGGSSWSECWLAWYDWSDRKAKSGLGGGWQTNKQMIGYFRKDLPKTWQKRGEGYFIPYPPTGGVLRVRIGSGLLQFDYGVEVKRDLFGMLRWAMYKDLKVEVVDEWGKSLDIDDKEYRGELVSDAKDDLSIDTTCGTLGEPIPSARGVYRHVSDLSPVTTWQRGGVTDVCERLLINTIYSQMAERRNVLSGDGEIDAGGVQVYSEQNQGAKKFWVTAETIDVQAGECEVELTELRGDDYIAAN